ncbi:hypothetical protein [Mahella australiensis]|uniref:hypothetical protein n=1 Tax=Mahella australiensis TaxID=252966 RepID=UPI0002ECC21F|nr:hypothetical protein [Mahella australiensis]
MTIVFNELLGCFEVIIASVFDVKEAHKLIESLDQKHNETIIDKCEVLTADKEYDDSKLINVLLSVNIWKAVQ